MFTLIIMVVIIIKEFNLESKEKEVQVQAKASIKFEENDFFSDKKGTVLVSPKYLVRYSIEVSPQIEREPFTEVFFKIDDKIFNPFESTSEEKVRQYWNKEFSVEKEILDLNKKGKENIRFVLRLIPVLPQEIIASLNKELDIEKKEE